MVCLTNRVLASCFEKGRFPTETYHKSPKREISAMTSTAEMQDDNQNQIPGIQTSEETQDLMLLSPFTLSSNISDNTDLADILVSEDLSNGRNATRDDLPEQESEKPLDSTPISGRSRSSDREESCQSVMNGSKPKKRKPDERKIPSSERSRAWRERKKELDPSFKEKERMRSRARRQNSQRHGTTNQLKSSCKETQTDISVSGLELLLKIVPLPEHPGRNTFAEPMEGNTIPSFAENILEKDCDRSVTNGILDTESFDKSFSKMTVSNGEISQPQERDRNTTSTTNTNSAVLESIRDDTDDERESLSPNGLDTSHEDFQVSNDVYKGKTTTSPPEIIIQERKITYEDANIAELYTPFMKCYFPIDEHYIPDDGENNEMPWINDIQTFQNKIYVWAESNYVEATLEDQTSCNNRTRFYLNRTCRNLVTSISISPRTGAIWYTKQDNSVFSYLQDKSMIKFRTRFPPKLLLVESSNESDTLYLFQNEKLEIWDENGQMSGQSIRFVSSGMKSFMPASMKRDSVSGRLLVTDDSPYSCSYAILMDSSLNQTMVRFKRENINSGCFDHDGNIIVGTNNGIYVLSGSSLDVKQYIKEPKFSTRMLCLPNKHIMTFDGNNLYSFAVTNKQSLESQNQ